MVARDKLNPAFVREFVHGSKLGVGDDEKLNPEFAFVHGSKVGEEREKLNLHL